MMRRLGLGLALVFSLGALAACTGETGPAGPQGSKGLKGDDGKDGTDGTGTASVSAVSPTNAFLSRTIDVQIAGNGTEWADKTTVDFGDNIKVNKITVGSGTGLVANITIDKAAAIGARDVTVTDDAGGKEVFKGAFNINSPLKVTIDQPDGVPQGGVAIIHAQMLDLSTPFDVNNISVAFSVDIASGDPTATDYGVDFAVEADVLAAAGDVDLTVTSGVDPDAIDSPAAKAFKVAARTPKTLSAAAASTGTIASESDTALLEYTPADASQRFVQFNLSATSSDPNASVSAQATLIPKSGKYADGSPFAGRIGMGLKSADPYYVVVTDGQSLFGAGDVPFNYSLNVVDVACTAMDEGTETAAANNNGPLGAISIAKLPGLVNGTLGYGAVTADADVDYFTFTVSGATQAAPKKIHVATGGDPATDAILTVYDTDGITELGTSDDADYQEDLVVNVTKDGKYAVKVFASDAGYFDPTHNTYQLFVEVK